MKNIKSSHSQRSFLTGSFTQSIYLNPTTKEEIVEIAKTFISGKAAGYDQIPMSIIKQSIHLISEPLTHIVPDEMKIARVIPVFKVPLRRKFFFLFFPFSHSNPFNEYVIAKLAIN